MKEAEALRQRLIGVLLFQEVVQFVNAVELAASGRGELLEKIMVSRPARRLSIVLVNDETGRFGKAAGYRGPVAILALAGDFDAIFAGAIGRS